MTTTIRVDEDLSNTLPPDPFGEDNEQALAAGRVLQPGLRYALFPEGR
jgi:hypothetical protein